jgi:hypothetical protein
MNNSVDQLAQTLSASPLTFWILGSVLAYGLATNVLWLARSRGLKLPPYGDWLVQVVRFVFYLGIPYLALGGWPQPPFSALLSPEDMGLVGLGGRWPVTRWLGAVGAGLGFGLVAFVFLLLAWANANRRADSAPPDGVRLRFPPQPWWAILIDVLYLEVHWAFYRGALAVVLGDVYAGVLLGLGLVYLEWSLNPYWRAGWRNESQAAAGPSHGPDLPLHPQSVGLPGSPRRAGTGLLGTGSREDIRRDRG